MCLVAASWQSHPRYRLILAGNRDEFHERPTAPLGRWSGHPGLLAGRDLSAGGLWMGVTEDGRAGVVTNVRDLTAPTDGRSRGELLRDFLTGSDGVGAENFVQRLAQRGDAYRAFNLMVFDPESARFVSNRPASGGRTLGPGIHALSNGPIEAPWPKSRALAAALGAWSARDDAPIEELFLPLADEAVAPDSELPDTGIGLERERLLSAAFIRGDRYGTRASTVLAIEPCGRGVIIERRFGRNGIPQGETRLEFARDPSVCGGGAAA